MAAVPLRPTVSAPRVLLQVLVAPVAPRTWMAMAHLAMDLISASFISLPLVILTALAFGTLPILPLSILLFIVLAASSRIGGHLERMRLRSVPGLPLTNPYRPLAEPWHRKLVLRARSAAPWKELAFHLVHLPKAVLFVSIAATVWGLALALAALPLYAESSPAGQADIFGAEIEPGGQTVALSLVGWVLILVAPWVTRGLSRASAGMATGLLSGGEAEVLRARVDTLEASRAGVIDAAEAERRRIERDLHDGAQQRLVALAMALGLAREKIDSDPVAARALVDEAHREAKSALVELRDLTRGLHPPVLADRGLEAAVAGLASRAPVPVEVDVRVARRTSPSIEGIAYFVISESLTNVARHSGAARARVRVHDTSRTLVVEVSDDGHGGASAAHGSGLRGLADRVDAVDGTFVVTSPLGGPTTIRAEIPLPFDGAPTPVPAAAPSVPSPTEGAPPCAS